MFAFLPLDIWVLIACVAFTVAGLAFYLYTCHLRSSLGKGPVAEAAPASPQPPRSKNEPVQAATRPGYQPEIDEVNKPAETGDDWVPVVFKVRKEDQALLPKTDLVITAKQKMPEPKQDSSVSLNQEKSKAEETWGKWRVE